MSAPLPVLLARLANTLETARLEASDTHYDAYRALVYIHQAQDELEAIRASL